MMTLRVRFPIFLQNLDKMDLTLILSIIKLSVLISIAIYLTIELKKLTKN